MSEDYNNEEERDERLRALSDFLGKMMEGLENLRNGEGDEDFDLSKIMKFTIYGEFTLEGYESFLTQIPESIEMN